MKQTAVEWLIEKLSYSTSDGTIISHHFIINKLVEQAKEMEKQQMRDASCPYVGGWEDDEFEYWYNQTYKSEQ
jgi:hypothetical protein